MIVEPCPDVAHPSSYQPSRAMPVDIGVNTSVFIVNIDFADCLMSPGAYHMHSHYGTVSRSVSRH